MDMTVPQQPGRYVSHWRLALPGDLQFGQRVWAMVQVRRGSGYHLLCQERDVEIRRIIMIIIIIFDIIIFVG